MPLGKPPGGWLLWVLVILASTGLYVSVGAAGQFKGWRGVGPRANPEP
jgi:hypothetical protein